MPTAYSNNWYNYSRAAFMYVVAYAVYARSIILTISDKLSQTKFCIWVGTKSPLCVYVYTKCTQSSSPEIPYSTYKQTNFLFVVIIYVWVNLCALISPVRSGRTVRRSHSHLPRTCIVYANAYTHVYFAVATALLTFAFNFCNSIIICVPRFSL